MSSFGPVMYRATMDDFPTLRDPMTAILRLRVKSFEGIVEVGEGWCRRKEGEKERVVG